MATDQDNKKPLWHTKDIDSITKQLNTDSGRGLSEKDAAHRLDTYGFNELQEKKGRSPFKIFISQFNDFMIWILIAAALISGFIIKDVTDALVILFILIINSVLGFVQEYRAEKALQALKELATPTAIVIRDGKEKNMNSKNIVPGDILKLASGDLIPADCRVIDETNLQSDESAITGESLPVEKTTEKIKKENLTLGDRINMLYSGTTIVKGRCTAMVVETGNSTEIGKIAGMVQEQEESTPLQKELKTVGIRIGIICLAVSVIVFLAGILKGNSFFEMFMVAVALAVASIPEGLPAIVTISLALGVQKMAKNNALIRKLSSVETLGGVTVICTDKTGTLTENKMTVRSIYTGTRNLGEYEKFMKSRNTDSNNTDTLDNGFKDNLSLRLLSANAVLCNDAYYLDMEKGSIAGDPTEAALIEMGSLYSLDKKELEEQVTRVLEEPFDSIRKMMSTINKLPESEGGGILKIPADGDNEHSYILFAKGAPEVITNKCSRIMKDNEITDLDESDKKRLHDINKDLASNAMRNLAFAFKYLDELPDRKKIAEYENDLVYLGMVGMIDPPRPEVYDAIEKCKKANIQVVMITGDHKLTAQAIGRELGILKEGDNVLDGEQLDMLSGEELEKEIEHIRIFARVSPSNKVDIVDALKKKKHIVAMTGDGINDAPSLKKADIGIAMGIVGTDVSKESSDMILADDNFATIVSAIKEGRVIYDNLKKFVLFLLSCNISEILIMFISIVIGDYILFAITGESGLLYIPLLPVQILWMNLITDGLPAMALGVNPAEPNIMDRKATRSKEQILSRRGLSTIIWQGAVLTIGALFIYFAGPVLFNTHHIIHDREIFQTSVFTTLVLTQLFHTFNYRFENKGIFRKGIFGNKYLNIAIIASIILQIAIIYVPFLQNIFNTASLGLNHWLLVIASSVIPVIIINFINEILYKRKNGRNRL